MIVTDETRTSYNEFRDELEAVVRRHRLKIKRGDTPDFLLAEYITNCLLVYDSIVEKADGYESKSSG